MKLTAYSQKTGKEFQVTRIGDTNEATINIDGAEYAVDLRHQGGQRPAIQLRSLAARALNAPVGTFVLLREDWLQRSTEPNPKASNREWASHSQWLKENGVHD